MGEQDQRVAGGSTAIQSGGNTTINHGLTPGDMQKLLHALGAQFPAMLEAARQLVDVRFEDFEKRILERFSKDANPNACADPDFVYSLRLSQHSYARCGDEKVRDTLIDLIARRSHAQTHSRLALTLNEAIQRAAALTKDEFAELSLCYLLKHTINKKIVNLEIFGNYFEKTIAPLLPEISKENSSYQYIEAQSCGSVAVLGGTGAVDMFRARYGGVFSGGLDKAQLEDFIPEKYRRPLNEMGLIIPCLRDNTKFQLGATNADAFANAVKAIEMPEKEAREIWRIFADKAVWNGDIFLSNVEHVAPHIRQLAEVWDQTPIRRLTLTSVGIAIAHSNLVRLVNFDGDINTWIK